MDAVKAQAFRNTIDDWRQMVLTGTGEGMSAQDKFEVLERFDDTWYEPLCFGYNLMAPLDYPLYIKDRFTQIKEMKEGLIFIYITLGYGQWIDRENLFPAMANVGNME